jgi:hypothetical protein
MSEDETWREFITDAPATNVVPMKGAGGGEILPFRPRPRRRLAVFTIGAGLGATSLAMNLTYAIGSATTLADQLSWASGATLVEALSLVMPSLALDFSRQRQRFASATCAAIALTAIGLATWSNLDYIRQASADKVAARAAVAESREGLRAKIALAAAERNTIAEARSVDEITVAISRQRLAPWAAAETTNCTTHGTDIAERQCSPLRRLFESRATAAHRDRLDSVLAADRAQLSAMPAVSGVSPSALRIILFALVPGALAGPVLMLARW